MIQQLKLFGITIFELKIGKKRCPCCGKLMRAYCKTLDKRLIKQAWDIKIFLREKRCETFNPREVWNDNYKMILDFQKLGYWAIVERTGRSGFWKMTERGNRFLLKGLALPRELWIFNNEVIESSEDMITVDQADERWQAFKDDYTMDYLPFNYNTKI